jgi:hypothetical protein
LKRRVTAMTKFKPGDRVTTKQLTDVTVRAVHETTIDANDGAVYRIADIKHATGGDELRLIVRNMDSTRESFNDSYTTEQLIQIYRMQLASEWDFYPDQWTARQVREALAGKVPRWTDDEKPLYAEPPERKS